MMFSCQRIRYLPMEREVGALPCSLTIDFDISVTAEPLEKGLAVTKTGFGAELSGGGGCSKDRAEPAPCGSPVKPVIEAGPVVSSSDRAALGFWPPPSQLYQPWPLITKGE